MDQTKYAILDTETTGLDPHRHEVWEIAVIVRENGTDTEARWMVRPDLSTADPRALRIGRFYERTVGVMWSDPGRAAQELARMLDGAVVVGSNPSFDQAFLTRWLRAYGQCWTAHYRTIDVITLGWGHLMGTKGIERSEPMPRTGAISLAHEVDPDVYDRHTALEDVRWCRDLFDTIVQGPPSTITA